MGVVVQYSRLQCYVRDIYVGMYIGGGIHSWGVEEAPSFIGGVG